MRILVLCAANPAVNPRPSRMIENLKKSHNVTAMGLNSTPIDGVEVLSYSEYKKRNLWQEIGLYFNVFFKRWNKLIYTKNRLEIQAFLKKRDFDLIICHDLVLLPIVLENKQGAKILFDAREFYPKQYTNSLRWRILFQKFNDYLCRVFLPKADKIITVGLGIKKAYKEFYELDSEVFYSFSKFFEISPSLMQSSEIRMIYHGYANRAREIEKTITIMDYCNSDFSLDLMLICPDKKYLKKLEKMVEIRRKQGKKIRIIPPVSFDKLITFSNAYDIGLYALPKSNLNLELTMPNKFFEYIQARLALVTIPHKEMEWFIQRYQNGIVAKNYDSRSIAHALNSLDKNQIMKMKLRSHSVANILSNEQNQQKINTILKDIFLRNSILEKSQED